MWRPLQLLKKWENSKRGIITGSLGCQNSPICHVKVCYDYISQASPPIDYPTKNCSRQQQGDKFFSLFVYITCYFVIDHLNVIGWLNVDHSVFQKEELWLALIYLCSNCIPFYIIYVSLGVFNSEKALYKDCMKFRGHRVIWSVKLWPHPRETTHPNQSVAILMLKGTVLYSNYYFNHMATYHVQTHANFLGPSNDKLD